MTNTPSPQAVSLLPCPFCGGEAEIIHLEDGDNAGGSCVCCTSCQASGNVEFGFKENFVENWNRRASPALAATSVGVCQHSWTEDSAGQPSNCIDCGSAVIYPATPSPDADKLDAERFRALMRCGRIKMQGSSGVDRHTLERNGNNVHFGAEFWPEPYEPDQWETTYGQSTRWGRACLRHLADAVIENEALARLSTTEAGG